MDLICALPSLMIGLSSARVSRWAISCSRRVSASSCGFVLRSGASSPSLRKSLIVFHSSSYRFLERLLPFVGNGIPYLLKRVWKPLAPSKVLTMTLAWTWLYDLGVFCRRLAPRPLGAIWGEKDAGEASAGCP